MRKKRLIDEEALERVRRKPCCICGTRPVDASHIKTRGSGGPDADFNLRAKCRKHHIEWGALGFSRFFKKYPVLWFDLQRDGWVIENGKLWNEKLATCNGSSLP